MNLNTDHEEFLNAMNRIRRVNNHFKWTKAIGRFQGRLIDAEKKGVTLVDGMDYQSWTQKLDIEIGEDGNGVPVTKEVVLAIDDVFYQEHLSEAYQTILVHFRDLYKRSVGQLNRKLKYYKDDLMAFLEVVRERCRQKEDHTALYEYLVHKEAGQGILFYHSDDEIKNFISCLQLKNILPKRSNNRNTFLNFYGFFKLGVKPNFPIVTNWSARAFCHFYKRLENSRKNHTGKDALNPIEPTDFDQVILLKSGGSPVEIDTSNDSTSKEFMNLLTGCISHLTE